jgi:site-specific recombinase XerD
MAETEPAPGEVVVDAELVDERGGELVGYAGGPPTAAQVYEEWIRKYEAKSLNTAAAYERNFTEWCDWLADEGIADILRVHTRHVERWKEHLERTDNPNTGKPLAAASIAQRIAAVSSYYKMARRLEAVQRNPAEDAERPDVDADSSDERELTEEESRRLITTAFDLVPLKQTQDVRRVAERDAEIVAFLLCTGARVSEARSARVEHLGYKRGKRTLTTVRKGRKQGVIALGACTEMIDRRVAGRTDGWIWTTRSGKQVSRAWVYFAIQRIAKAAAIPDPHTVGPHALRAAFVMLSLDYGASLYDVQLAVGHSDPRTTVRYDRRRDRIDDSPVHLTSHQLLDKNPGQKERLF